MKGVLFDHNFVLTVRAPSWNVGRPGRSRRTSLVVTPAGEVRHARRIRDVEPEYPLSARERRIEGAVQVEVTIDACGRVRPVRALDGPSDPHEAARKAVSRWEYEPATLKGVPIATSEIVTVDFALER